MLKARNFLIISLLLFIIYVVAIHLIKGLVARDLVIISYYSNLGRYFNARNNRLSSRCFKSYPNARGCY